MNAAPFSLVSAASARSPGSTDRQRILTESRQSPDRVPTVRQLSTDRVPTEPDRAQASSRQSPCSSSVRLCQAVNRQTDRPTDRQTDTPTDRAKVTMGEVEHVREHDHTQMYVWLPQRSFCESLDSQHIVDVWSSSTLPLRRVDADKRA